MAVASSAATALAVAAPAAAQTAPEYTFRQAMISTRDGVRLYTTIFAPKDQREPLPFMFIRTPYGAAGEQYQVARGYPELAAARYIFQKGHRVMVQLQSTWFPLIDRNPQTWVPNIFEAKESDFKAQTHRVWRTPTQASRVDVQVVP